MNAKDRYILDEFKKEKENFEKLEDIVCQILHNVVTESNATTLAIEHRIKKEKSLEMKLYRKSEKYQTLYDITDLLGTRIICCFVDDVYKIGKKIEEIFNIDRENCVDKSKVMDVDTFGYLSLHYICSLKEGEGYPEELLNKRFEIQIRSILQHAWAVAEHDICYKNEFGVPRDAVRGLARLAGLLELADNEFVRTRDYIKDYTEEIIDKISNDKADDIDVNIISLREYMTRNKSMRRFLDKLSDIDGADIMESNPDNYILQLKFLNIETIGQLQEMLERNSDLALTLAKRVLEGAELDILASNIALRFICQAELIKKDYTEEDIEKFLSFSISNKTRIKSQAKRLLNVKKELQQ